MNEARTRRRTVVAIALALAAAIVPGPAWLVVGQDAAQEQAGVFEKRPPPRGEVVARTLADRMLGRLEAIRDAESQRPVVQFKVHHPRISRNATARCMTCRR